MTGGRPLIETRDLTKVYAMGDEVVALRGVTWHRARRVRRDHGRLGLGQVDADEHLGCLDTPTDGHYRLDGEDVSRRSIADQLAAIRNREIGFVFQSFNLLPRTTALENVELPLVYAGVPATSAGSARAQLAGAVGLGDRAATAQASCRAASSSAWRSRARWSTEPPILLADEPTGASTRDERGDHGLFDELHAAGHHRRPGHPRARHRAHATRIVAIRDGKPCSTSGRRARG